MARTAAALAVALVAALALPLRAARAWSLQGHMVGGLLAHDELRRLDPRLVAEVERLMAHHPDRARFAARLAGLSGIERTRWLFAWMARWPDDARGGPRDRPTWHYAVRLVTPGWSTVGSYFGEAHAAFPAQLALAARTDAPPAERAVALCWVLHVAGDIQQPLHTATWMAWRFFPKSDRAGTLGFVRAAPGAPPVSLHEYWDGALDRPGADTAAARATAAALATRWPRAAYPTALFGPVDSARFASWMAEGRWYAARYAYRGAALDAADDSTGNAPVLPRSYAADARALAERRLALGAWRMADAVRAALGGAPLGGASRTAARRGA